ncbi:Receptor-like protein 12 [Morus notabilis]|uniref:Receptor-like protein 12 n=1 Tax=Morus notabilis TaxID=981085 RepID=W9R0N6_9ROSA|nr:Receptor-like protein 12 [Morus notabilis]
MIRTPPAFSWLCNFLMMINICSTLILLPLLSLQAAAAGQSCLSHERSLLLQLNNTLTFDLDPRPWDRSTDCCTWDGVRCEEGRVVGLDLSDKSIIGGMTDNSSLFQFQYLKTLDLSLNNFSTPMPSSFGNLTSLTHLNLADSGFVGQIPIELSRLTNLVTLDFTTTLLIVFPRSPLLKVHQSNWSMSFQNLTKLEELHLDFVDMSAAGKEWGRVFSSSLPNLRVLTMTGCSLSGPIHHSLRNLHSLSSLCLDGNPLSSPVPRFIANFPRLTSLILSNCGLYGAFPQEIFRVPSLEYVDVSFNPLLQGSFPEFPQNNSLQYLELSNTSFSGRIPTSINNLANLSTLDLSKSRFNGSVPNFMLTKLVYLDLSANKFTGLIPSSLFKAASLERIDLSDNEFHGQLPDFPNVSPSLLQYLYLGGNNLEGPIPMSIFELKNLSYLSLPFNNLNGTIQLESTPFQ